MNRKLRIALHFWSMILTGLYVLIFYQTNGFGYSEKERRKAIHQYEQRAAQLKVEALRQTDPYLYRNVMANRIMAKRGEIQLLLNQADKLTRKAERISNHKESQSLEQRAQALLRKVTLKKQAIREYIKIYQPQFGEGPRPSYIISLQQHKNDVTHVDREATLRAASKM